MTSAVVERARTQGRWMVASEIAIRGVQFLASIALAHLLMPAHFGLAAIAIVVWEMLALLGNTGVYATLVHRRGDIDELCRAAFWLNLTVALAVGGVGALASFAVRRVYQEPLLVPFLGLLATGFVIRAFGAIHLSLLAREGAFRRLAVAEAVTEIGRSVAAVGLALAGCGPWSLVIPAPASELLKVALLWRLQPWRPDLAARTHLWAELYAYGRWILGAEVVSYVSMRMDTLIAGGVLGTAPLGIYSRALRFTGLLAEAGTMLVARIAFPTLSALSEHAGRLAEAHTRLVRTVTILVLPVAMLMLVAADDFIAVLYGAERWGGAVPLARILLPMIVLRAIALPASQSLYAVGRARQIFRLQLGSLAPLAIGLYLASRFGTVGLVIAVTVGGTILSAALIALSYDAAGVRLRVGLSCLTPGLLIAAGAGTAAVLARLAVSTLAAHLGSALPMTPSGAALAIQSLRLVFTAGAAAFTTWAVLLTCYPDDLGFLLRASGLHALTLRLRAGNGQVSEPAPKTPPYTP